MSFLRQKCPTSTEQRSGVCFPRAVIATSLVCSAADSLGWNAVKYLLGRTTMSLLRSLSFYIRHYSRKHRNLAIGGAAWGIIAATFFGLYSPTPALLGLLGVFLVLGWPFGIKQMSGRVWLLCVAGTILSITLIHFTVHLGRALIPLVALGYLGSGVCGSLLICLRYRRPDLEPGLSAT